MIPTGPQQRFKLGERVRVTQFVRVGHRAWTTQVEGVVELEGMRPVGGMEMGGKAAASHQSTLRLRTVKDEVTVVALDENTKVETLDAAGVR